jgi:hypothetical protein
MCRAPEAIANVLGLQARSCRPEFSEPLPEDIRERMRQQVPGWRITTEGETVCLTQLWNAQVRTSNCPGQDDDHVRDSRWCEHGMRTHAAPGNAHDSAFQRSSGVMLTYKHATLPCDLSLGNDMSRFFSLQEHRLLPRCAIASMISPSLSTAHITMQGSTQAKVLHNTLHCCTGAWRMSLLAPVACVTRKPL